LRRSSAVTTPVPAGRRPSFGFTERWDGCSSLLLDERPKLLHGELVAESALDLVSLVPELAGDPVHLGAGRQPDRGVRAIER